MPFNANEKVCNNRSGVYAIVNIKTEKFYIGSAVNLRSRKSKHLSDLRKGKHHSKYLQNSYNKHGEECFIVKVLEYVEDENNLLKVEQKYLDIYFLTGITYNICGIAGSPLGLKRSEEAKRKMSEVKQNMSDETRVKMSESAKGKIISDETRKKMSLAQQNISNETRQKLSEARKGKKHSDEAKKKISEALKGKILSEERKQKLSEARKGRIHSNETKRKMSKAQKGKSMERCFKPVVQLTRNNELIKRYNSVTEAERETGASNISECCLGKRKSAGGYIWQHESLYNEN